MQEEPVTARQKLVERKIFYSRIHTEDVKTAEKWLGYLISLAGAILLNAVTPST